MQIAIGISLIIVGFLIPLISFIVYRRMKLRRLKKQVLNGEIFDKEGERFGIVKDGKQY